MKQVSKFLLVNSLRCVKAHLFTESYSGRLLGARNILFEFCSPFKMAFMSCIFLYRIVVFLCVSFLGAIFAGFQHYTSHSAMDQQITPPDSTLPKPRNELLQYVALGIGYHAYKCLSTGDSKLQSSYGTEP